ncbi:hypothetical protein MIND_00561300 [Mycena indigotica]|uniref:Uncharacterized protein n=1 Tax=Mycena indigotica TaxID=2126181 RepID=A0A8H6SPV8_9AGAR|nr:uncharacterized protein MIND_00561300 [Mycena indigotica]KAF7303336.1 hypothetical protein MIND_00561300 [Mycena indigotica]
MEKVYLGVLANATDRRRVILAVRGLLDFTYYVHFKVHTDESLALMERALENLHENKAVFEELGIREHFNISKLHKLLHYIKSIRARGIAPAFSTELSERLHIDFAKAGYRASNHRDYIPQMTKWLSRQEKVRKFSTFLEWTLPAYEAEFIRLQADDALEPDDTLPVQRPTSPSPPPTATLIHSIAKNPPFTLRADFIAREFHAPFFLFRLRDFLRSRSILPRGDLSEGSSFPVYKQLALSIPPVAEVGTTVLLDKIHAIARRESGNRKDGRVVETKPAQFDTVLVRVNGGNQELDPAKKYRAARLRVIFRVPEIYGSVHEPLAYVDWYKPLSRFNSDLGMYEISLSTQMNQQRSEIIPITSILQSCHLIPVFGKQINPKWESDFVLDQCSQFYLNPYLRHHDFYILRYLPELEAKRKAAEARRVRIRQLGRAGRFNT